MCIREEHKPTMRFAESELTEPCGACGSTGMYGDVHQVTFVVESKIPMLRVKCARCGFIMGNYLPMDYHNIPAEASTPTHMEDDDLPF